MKFLHVSTGDVRGAFSGAYRLHRNLIAQGHESVMLVGDKQGSDPTVVAPPKAVQSLGRFLVRATNQVLKLACGRDAQVRHHFAFNTALVPARTLVKALDGYRPHLVIAHYTSGFVSPAGLRELGAALGAPVALYLMDMEMLTGGCHYAWTCKGYLASCADCPVPPRGIVRRLIHRQWQARSKAFDRLQPVVIGGSGWLMRQAAASSLTGGLQRRQILMGIDTESHAPAPDKADLRRSFGLPEDGLVLYFGAQNLADPRKGFVHLKAALAELAETLTPAERARVVLFTVGKLDAEAMGEPPFAHVHRAYISDPRLFAATYAAADLFICPSVEDSGPMMINESIVSGTPVAAFEMGVAVDLVHTGVTGYRVPLGDAPALAAALAAFVRLTSAERATMAAACRALGVDKSSAQGQVHAFVELAQAARGANGAGLAL
jgi:glycosyltransferase involved in cell wall biosynthesis